jgi:hypothetical protein
VRISDLLTQPGTLVPERAVWTPCRPVTGDGGSIRFPPSV